MQQAPDRYESPVVVALAAIGAYILLVGVGSFIESPVGGKFDALQLNALIRIGSAILAVAAFVAVHGTSLPAPRPLVFGIGIGLIAGAGSICYCFALDHLSVSLVVSVANLSIVVTIALGVVILHESVVPLKVAALLLTVAGALALSRPDARRPAPTAEAAPARHGVRLSGAALPSQHRAQGFALLALYLALVGTGTFLEKPALQHLDATQLNALQAVGMLIVAAAALAGVREFPMPGRHAVGSIGVGAMIGLGSIFYFLGLTRLPLSIAVGAANGYVVVTILLAVVVGKEGLSWSKQLAIALTLAGVILFAFSA
jgi:drug/metabolite transporter (DMT)-like permease